MKHFGLALFAIAAMTTLVPSSASATSTTLCRVHEDPCKSGNIVTSVHAEAGISTLKTSIATVLCLWLLDVEEITGPSLASPLTTTVNSVAYGNCGTNASHTNCSITALTGGGFSLLKTALNLGTGTFKGVETLVTCDLLIDIHCVYGGTVSGFAVEGAGHSAGAGNGMVTASNLEVSRIKGSFCPEEARLTELGEPLAAIYLVS